jgi:hypothetical protein
VVLSQWAVAATQVDEPIYPGRHCACATGMLNTNDEFYCPSPIVLIIAPFGEHDLEVIIE